MFAISGIVFVILCMFLVGFLTRNMEDPILNGLVLVVTFLISACIFMVGSDELLPTHSEYQYSFNLAAVQDNKYIVGRTSLHSEKTYDYMTKQNGGYISGSVPQDASIIYESENSPELRVYRDTYNSKIAQVLLGKYKSTNNAYHYQFEVPKGSIKQDFNIDLQ